MARASIASDGRLVFPALCIPHSSVIAELTVSSCCVRAVCSVGLKPTDAMALKELQTKELNNGRLAMIGAAGMIAQELATGKKLFG